MRQQSLPRGLFAPGAPLLSRSLRRRILSAGLVLPLSPFAAPSADDQHTIEIPAGTQILVFAERPKRSEDAFFQLPVWKVAENVKIKGRTAIHRGTPVAVNSQEQGSRRLFLLASVDIDGYAIPLVAEPGTLKSRGWSVLKGAAIGAAVGGAGYGLGGAAGGALEGADTAVDFLPQTFTRRRPLRFKLREPLVVPFRRDPPPGH